MKWVTFEGFRGLDGIWGGNLVDQNMPFAMRDKVLHAVCSYFAAQIAYLMKIPPHYAVNSLGVLVESIEVFRYWLWWKSTTMQRKIGWVWDPDNWLWSWKHRDIKASMPPSPPMFADRFSLADLIANNIGALPIYIYALLN